MMFTCCGCAAFLKVLDKVAKSHLSHSASLQAEFQTPQGQLRGKIYSLAHNWGKIIFTHNVKERKCCLTKYGELLRHPLCHDLIFAGVGHLTLKHRPLVDRYLRDEGE